MNQKKKNICFLLGYNTYISQSKYQVTIDGNWQESFRD